MPRMADTMKTHGDAIDLFDGMLARRTYSEETRRQYRWILNHVADDAERVHKLYVNELELDDYERTLNRWTGLSPSTLSQRISCIRMFSKFVWKKGWADTWVCADLERPRRKRPEDVPVVTVSGAEVVRMLNAAEDYQELLCITTATYLGARRRALASVRRRDVDLENGLITFQEKGGKTIVKPLPDEYVAILRQADDDGIWARPEDYLIPNRRPAAVRRSERSDKIVWETIRRLAARAGVTCHVHALRAAFAVAFDEAHPDELIALKELMGHSRIETTLVYLRRKDRNKAMEAVRDLSWAAPSRVSRLPSNAGEAHTGFEPVLPLSAAQESGSAVTALSSDAPLLRKLAEVRARPVARDPRTKGAS